jgi:RND family efflux transporter MFP subunit
MAEAVFALDKKRAGLLIAALVASVVGVRVAASFHRALPETAEGAPGVHVGKNEVAIAADAPQWKSLRLGNVVPLGERWTDAFPARFKIDEAMASRIGSPLQGRVTRVFVELGQNVKKGTPLLSIASPDIAGFRAERQKAKVDLEVAHAQYDRVRAMVDARALPGKDELASDQQLKQAELSLALAQSKLDSLRVSLTSDNEFTIVAPRDGVVIDKQVVPAQQVSPNDTAITLADLENVWVVAELFEADANGIVAGSTARVTSPSLPGYEVEAKVEMVSFVADPERHSVAVRARLPNPGREIRPNAYAQVSFKATVSQGTVGVAASAVVSDGQKQYVYVQRQPGTFARREVVVASTHGGQAAIVSGLTAGEVVVERGSALLDNQIALSS